MALTISVPAPRVAYAAAFFALLMALIVLARPALVFRPDGTPRPFGVAAAGAEGATVYSLGVVTVVAAVLSLFLFTVIDVAA